MNILTTCIVQFTCEQLKSLVKTAYFYKLFVMTKHTAFFYVFWEYSIFSFFVMIVSVTTLITLILRGGRRLKFSELEKTMKKNSKKGK